MRSKNMFIDKKLPISMAWLSLTGKSQDVYLILLMRRKVKPVGKKKKGNRVKWVIANNGEIIFTYGEAKKLGMSDGVFRRAINQLRDRGFIEYETESYQAPNLFTLLDDWKSYGTPGFVPREPKARRYKSMGFQKGNSHGKNCS